MAQGSVADEQRMERAPATGAEILRPALLIGVGLAGTLDEVILHQLLRWHHLYDRSTRDAGLVSDGVFHAASTLLLAAGVGWAIAVLQHAPNRAAGRRRLWGGVLVGFGAFNLWDGIVQHKILRLHQVRPAAENWLPYDLAFVGLAALALAAGLLVLRAAPART